jgi:hypothetical protein
MTEPIHHHPATDDVEIQPLHGEPIVVSGGNPVGPIAVGQVAIDPHAGGGQPGGNPGQTTVQSSDSQGPTPTILQDIGDAISTVFE